MKGWKITLLGMGLVGLLSACERREPNSADYTHKDGISYQRLRLVDDNNDGKVDVITRSDDRTFAIWVAPDMVDQLKKEQKYYIDSSVYPPTKRMTPEIREAASRVMLGQRDLEYQLDKELYRHSQAKRE